MKIAVDAMEPAAVRLQAALDEITVADAAIPVVANVDGKIEYKGEQIKPALVRQAANPVLWVDCVKTMPSNGVPISMLKLVGTAVMLMRTTLRHRLRKESSKGNVCSWLSMMQV